MKIKKILKMTAILSITALTCVMCIFTVFAQTYKEIGGCLYFEFENDSYNAKATIRDYSNIMDVSPNWKIYLSEDGKEYALKRKNVVIYREIEDDFELGYIVLKIPDKITGKRKTRDVGAILESVACHEFDLNPKNKYMSLIDNVIFSKDGKTLMSYAQFDDRKVYEIPDGTKTIAVGAFDKSENLVEIIIPNSVEELSDAFCWMKALEKINIPPLVEELPDWSFTYCNNLKEVHIPKDSKLKKIGDHVFGDSNIKELTLPSFDIEIGSTAFLGPSGHVDTHFYEVTKDLKLKSYVKPEVKVLTSEGVQKLTWDKISNATKYEVYQKMKDGSYKLLKETTGTSLKLNNVKSDKKYTFAVKPIAKIRGCNTSVYVDKDYKLYYTIEGTMSDDVTIEVK